MQRPRATGRQSVSFDATESALFELDFEIIFARDEKGKYANEERIVADQKEMLPIVKTGETRDEVIDRSFGSKLGDFLELAFQSKDFGDDLCGLARSHEGTGEYRIEGYSQTTQASRRSPHSLDSFRRQRSLAVGFHPRLIRGDGDTMAHQIKIHWHTTALARLYRLLHQMAPVVQEQGGDPFVDFVSAAAILG
jgi:hypothetical protein